ncbi:MAG: tetrahydrofolate synthase [Treponema sp.]|jgi:dihydrofolate synthase/folylpolyglutamate synthase|nr:tetrahydrofolate synthase [Treponema sp.]
MVASFPSFTSSAQVFDWISQHINFEKVKNRNEFTLDTMKRLAELANYPEKSAPVIHVAGSKGKGSVAAYIAGILGEAGFTCARYASPHVADWRERVTAGAAFFDESIYIEAGDELFSVTERFMEGTKETASADAPDAQSDPEAPTFFELMTLYFFLCARKARCDVMVVETGMGGRLDATNIVDPLMSVITLIEKEHTERLGDTLALIAGEKAGIIKPGRPLALAEQQKEAYDVFVKRAEEKDSRLYYLPNNARLDHIRLFPNKTSFRLVPARPHTPLSLSVPTPGVVQAYNAALAALTTTVAFPHVSREAIAAGLAKTALISRFEKICDDPVVIVDGAHTRSSIAACADTWTTLYGSTAGSGASGVLLFGCAADKDIFAMASILFPLFSYIIVTRPGTFKTSFPEKVYAVFAELERTGRRTLRNADKAQAENIRFEPETQKAIAQAVSLGRGKKAPVLAAGSFYLTGDVIAYMKNNWKPTGEQDVYDTVENRKTN